MLKTALFALTFTFSAGAHAAELNGICAAEIKANFTAAVPAPSIVRAYQAPSGASVCEAAMANNLGYRPTFFRDVKGQPLRGFDKAYYTEYGDAMPVSLVLQTTKEAFYYYEDCDICASIDKCDLRTGFVSRVVSAHSAGCYDIAAFTAGAVYNACAKPESTCEPVGAAVRIPGECCSRNAEPAYGGEMVCVAAEPAVIPSCEPVGAAVRIPGECCSGNAEPAYGGEMICVTGGK